jgi:hypothetical protein
MFPKHPSIHTRARTRKSASDHVTREASLGNMDTTALSVWFGSISLFPTVGTLGNNPPARFEADNMARFLPERNGLGRGEQTDAETTGAGAGEGRMIGAARTGSLRSPGRRVTWRLAMSCKRA